MKSASLVIGAFALLLLLVGCSAATGTPPPVSLDNTDPQGYPAPLSTVSSYPGLAAEPDPSPVPGEVAFQFDKPVLVNATQVTGSGLPGVPIVLHNVTFMGEVMGQTTIDSDGRFEFTVPPLEANVRLGLAVGDLAGTPWIPEYFDAPGFRGDEPMSLPNVGYFLDTVQIEAP